MCIRDRYDARVADEFKIFTNVNTEIVDPKNFKPTSFISKKGKECIIPPNSFVLASTVEYFKVPEDVLVICLGKSTYARCGIIVNVTPLEPSWCGHVTLEFSNTTPLPAKIYANEGAAQFLFSAKVLRDSTTIVSDNEMFQMNNDYAPNVQMCSYSILDTPSSTSSLTYKLQARRNASATGRVMYFEASSSSSGDYWKTHIITLMEIKG